MTQEEKAKVYTELINSLEDVKNAIKKQNYGIAMDILCKPYPEYQITTSTELKESENIRKRIIDALHGDVLEISEIKEAIDWLKTQGKHSNFLSKIQVGDKVTRNEDGVLVNLSQLKRIAKPAEKQGKNNMGISEATKKKLEGNLNNALEKETSESWNEFLDEQGEQKSIDKIQIGKKYKCIASPRYSTFMIGKIYKPEDKFLCSLMNFCSDCFEPIEDGKQKPTDKIEPKFKVEEEKWYVCTQTYVLRGKIVVIKGQTYQAEKDNVIKGEDGCLFIDRHDGKASEYFRYWTIKDAKDGDVLSWDDSKCIALFKNIYDKESFNSYGFLGHCTGTFELRMSYHDIEGVHPATKEQRDQLEKAIADAGYEWDAKNKQLRKIEPRQEELTEFEKAVKQVMEEAIECGDTHNFKADADMLLRLVQKSSWSEEDEGMLFSVIWHLRNSVNNGDQYKPAGKLEPWIRTLKERVQPRPTWKPSDEQMVAVQEAMNIVGILTITGSKINSLYQDLKKLKEK